jgi:hypothetical protein
MVWRFMMERLEDFRVLLELLVLLTTDVLPQARLKYLLVEHLGV